MTPEQAVATIKNMTFRPGWKLGAEVDSATTIRVWADMDTVDTSYPSADGRFGKRIMLQPDELIDVSDLNLAGLCHAILTQLVARIDSHENREFLQVRTGTGRWYAPLHPHTYEGEVAWIERTQERVEHMIAQELVGAA